jgi:hypothetical protein
VPIANIIRKCWVSNPIDRPNFNWVIEELMKEISFFGKEKPVEEEEGIESEEGSSGEESDDGPIGVDPHVSLNR